MNETKSTACKKVLRFEYDVDICTYIYVYIYVCIASIYILASKPPLTESKVKSLIADRKQWMKEKLIKVQVNF